MTILGVRCSNRDFAYAVLDGRRDAPELIEVTTLSYPKGFVKAQSLHWLYQEADGLFRQNGIEKFVIKRFEGQSRGAPFEDRVEHEAAVMLAAAQRGMKAVLKARSPRTWDRKAVPDSSLLLTHPGCHASVILATRKKRRFKRLGASCLNGC